MKKSKKISWETEIFYIWIGNYKKPINILNLKQNGNKKSKKSC